MRVRMGSPGSNHMDGNAPILSDPIPQPLRVGVGQVHAPVRRDRWASLVEGNLRREELRERHRGPAVGRRVAAADVIAIATEDVESIPHGSWVAMPTRGERVNRSHHSAIDAYANGTMAHVDYNELGHVWNLQQPALRQRRRC